MAYSQHKISEGGGVQAFMSWITFLVMTFFILFGDRTKF